MFPGLPTLVETWQSIDKKCFGDNASYFPEDLSFKH